jgi:zinc finger CCCH domain-containing protein 13
MIEAPRDKKRTGHDYDDAMMSGGLGDGAGASTGAVSSVGWGNLRENPNVPGQYTGYVRNPPPPTSLAVNAGRRND